MPGSDRKLLLISRDDILDTFERLGATIYPRLAWFTRNGFHLLATAPQPDRWSSGSDHVDTALLGPESIRTRLYEAGGNLDGVYYVRKSLLTQRRNREQALNDMLSRYALRADCCFLLSSSGKFSDVAASLGIRAVHLTRSRTLEAELDRMKADYEAASAG